jgi:hypothetical protein
MTSNNAEWLLNYMIAAPFIVVAIALFMYWFTGWLDRREDRRRHGAE